MFVEDLLSFLSDQETDAANRIYPNQLPQGVTLPAIRYFEVSDPIEHSHSGRSKLRHPRWQLDCFGAKYFDAKKLADQIIAVLDGRSGTMVGFAENARDNHDPETGRHWVTLDFEIWYTEA